MVLSLVITACVLVQSIILKFISQECKVPPVWIQKLQDLIKSNSKLQLFSYESFDDATPEQNAEVENVELRGEGDGSELEKAFEEVDVSMTEEYTVEEPKAVEIPASDWKIIFRVVDAFCFTSTIVAFACIHQ